MNSADPRRPRSSLFWAKLTVLALGLGVLVLVSAPVALADCPPIDPLCLTESAPPVPPIRDEVEKVIDDAVKAVKAQVDRTVGPVTDTLDELVNPGGDKPGGGGGGGDEGGSGKKPPAGPGDDERSDSPVGNLSDSVFPASRPSRPANAPDTPAVATTHQPGLFDRIGDAAVEAARQLGFPLALAVIVLAFAMIQNYLDRRDPKLALAPIRPEVLRFD